MCGPGQVVQHTSNLNSFCEIFLLWISSDPVENYNFTIKWLEAETLGDFYHDGAMSN